MTNKTNILGENTGTGRYNPELAKQIAKQIEQEEKQAKLEARIKPKIKKIINNPSYDDTPIPGYIFVPSLGSYVGQDITLTKNDWYSCHRKLQAQGQRMLTIPEFIEFVKYLKANPQGVKDANSKEVYKILGDILTTGGTYRAEWLDAEFQINNELMYVTYNHEVKTYGNIKPKNAELLESCLFDDGNIDLDSWLNKPTKQGLPREAILDGDLKYIAPKSDNMLVAGFYANQIQTCLHCAWGPHDSGNSHGVRPIIKTNPTN